ncbi:MAG: serine/threonine-protein phosphatase [Anaerolineaceae bacterium]|nr:serine/threonine-protein phosphatase [Anaerolineaceae bacterium]
MQQYQLLSAGKSDVGRVRGNNEDYLSYFEPGDPEVLEKFGRLYIVADGVGGAAKGEVASKFAARSVLHTYFSQPLLEPWQRLKIGMKIANTELVNYIHSHTQARMATTMVAAAINGDELTLVNVGDSRAYLIRNHHVRLLTQDHNLVSEMIRSGVIAAEEEETANVKNQLTSSLGGHSIFKADTFVEKILPGDRLLLCSDGLARYADDEMILKLVESGRPREVVINGIQFARNQGGVDNITALALQFEELADFGQVQEDRGAKPIRISLQEVIDDPLTMVARSPEEELVQRGITSKPYIFIPDPDIPPIAAGEADSISGINMARSEEEDDALSLRHRVPPAPNRTNAPTRVTQVVRPAAPERAPQTKKKPFAERFSTSQYVVMILLALLVFIVLLASTVVFGGRYLDARKQPNAGVLPTAMETISEPTIPLAAETLAELPPTATVEALAETAVTEIAVVEETDTQPIEINPSGAGQCIAKPRSGDGLSQTLERFGVAYDPGATYYYYATCTAEDPAGTCGERQELPPAQHGVIQDQWHFEMDQVEFNTCVNGGGMWLPENDS